MDILKRFIHYYKPHKKLFFLDLLCAFTISICDLSYPLISREILNTYIPNHNLRMVFVCCTVMLGIYLLKAAMNYFVMYWGHIVGVRMQAHMRNDVFKHLQKLPFSFYDNNKTGTLMSRIVNDLMDISELAHHGPEDLFISLVMIIGSFTVLCTINLPLTVIVFLPLPFMVWYCVKKRRKMSAAFTETRKQIGEINTRLENSISGIRVSKSYTAQSHEIQKFENSNHEFQRVRGIAYRVMAEFHTGNSFVLDLLNMVILVSGAVFIYMGRLSLVDFLVYTLYIGMFFNPIRRLIQFVETYENGISGFKRFLEIMDTPAEEDFPNAEVLTNIDGKISFQNVSFSYENGSEILNDISFTAEPGQTVALVGSSGGGKTTICHLIPRFYEINSGTISIDDKDIRQIKRESLRQSIGLVQQDVFIFGGTIYENLLYGRLDAAPEEVYEAAKKANIHDYIMTLPNGYDTQVGERGLKLSGGQKQRISIARVFLKNPPILILDEATSALDNVTEQLIQNSLDELTKGRTTIVVAHRLSTIRNADRIMVVTSDGIAEQGTHSELMEKNGIYAQLNR